MNFHCLTKKENLFNLKQAKIKYQHLHNLLNFEVSLLDEEGKLIQFKTGEDKIPALNFTIQIITKKMLKVKKPVYTQKKKKKY